MDLADNPIRKIHSIWILAHWIRIRAIADFAASLCHSRSSHLRIQARAPRSLKNPRCHGLGIVDINELNSYLNYCSHRREYRIWREKKKRNLSMGKGVFIHDLCDHAKCFLCLLAWWRLLISATEAALSRRGVEPSHILPKKISFLRFMLHTKSP